MITQRNQFTHFNEIISKISLEKKINSEMICMIAFAFLIIKLPQMVVADRQSMGKVVNPRKF